MTNAVPALLADAVATVINAAVTAVALETVGFTARRSYPDWDDEFKDLSGLAVDTVFVSSGGDQVELDSESTIDTEPSVDIAIRKRFGPTDRETNGRLKNTSVDPLVKLVEQVHELLSADRQTPIELVAGTVYANWISATVRTYCDYRRLREGNFLGVVRVRFDVSKAG